MTVNFLKIQLNFNESYFSLDDIWRDLGSRRDRSHRVHTALALLVQSLPAPLMEGVGIRLVVLDEVINHTHCRATPGIAGCKRPTILE